MGDLKRKLEKAISAQVPRVHPSSVDFMVLTEGDFQSVNLLVVVVDGRLDLGLEVVRKDELHFSRRVGGQCRAHPLDVRAEGAIRRDVFLNYEELKDLEILEKTVPLLK